LVAVSSGGLTDRLRAAFGDVQFDHLRLEADGELLWVYLNRPTRLNAMTDRMLREFQSLYRGVEAGGWRCVVLAGEGRAFCAGADLGQINNVIDFTDAEQVREYLDSGWQRVVESMRTVAVPTVAAVHGPAYGGGANLALAADLVVAAESAVFCQSYVDRGISPDLGGTVILPRLVGVQQARRQLLLGEPVNAAEALRIGMVCCVVPDDELRPRARALARTLAAKDTRALNVIRRLVDENVTQPLRTALANESRGVGETLGGPVFEAATHRYRPAGQAQSGAPMTSPVAPSAADE
jgi:2-(1,2-epoxy-1,2-dihydrophenyl)acetyl-CoA isomerase